MHITNEHAKRIRVTFTALDLCGADLAKRLGVAPSTVSGWLTGRQPAPDNFLAQVEEALGLRAGILQSEALDLTPTITR